MLGLFLLFALNYLFSALFSKKTALLLTNQNGEIFSCILLAAGIDHFTVSCLVAWPLNESEAGGDLVLIETSLLFSC